MRHTAKIKKRISSNTFMLHSKSTYFYKHKWFSYLIPSLCSIALLSMFGIIINPVISTSTNNVYAEGESDNSIIPENGVALRIDTSLNSNNTIEEQVSGNGTKYIKVDFVIGANNIQNYDIYVQADSTALTGVSHGEKLQSITSNTTGNLSAKQWGYSVERGDVNPSSMTYKPIQTSVSASADGQNAGQGNTLTGISQPYTLAFAANLDGMTADHYKSNITLSVAAGAGEVVNREPTGFGWIENMQDMTSGICNTMGEGITGTLRDIRDNKVYWVAKLKDGNCWMTQNLDLDLYVDGTGKKLTTADSDVLADWISTSSTPSLSWTGGGDNRYAAVKYFDPGDYIYTTPATRQNCTTSVGLANCAEKGWVNTNGMFASDNPDFTGVVNGNVYDAHYLAGNYYSWGAATAGQAASITGAGEATQSICPKGWRLPPNSGNKSYSTLLTAYGAYQANTLLYGTQDIRIAPLYFVYSGYTGTKTRTDEGIDAMAIARAGSNGYYWSSTAYSADMARILSLADKVEPTTAEGYNRSYGYNVRCVAK